MGEFASAEVNALHAGAFGHRIYSASGACDFTPTVAGLIALR